MAKNPFMLDLDRLLKIAQSEGQNFLASSPFQHIVVDDFLPKEHIDFFSDHFPEPDHPVWLDWRKRSPSQYGKQGPGNSEKFSLLDDPLQLALYELISWKFLLFLEELTGIKKLLPDPYFTGGGIHQILHGGILDIHTDFNDYKRLGIYRRLNVLIYLTKEWHESWGGALELWDGDRESGKCVKSIGPIYNRMVIFKTDKNSYHGHPAEWNAPNNITRRSIALYYYTAGREEGAQYDENTDFQGIARKDTETSKTLKNMLKEKYNSAKRKLGRN